MALLRIGLGIGTAVFLGIFAAKNSFSSIISKDRAVEVCEYLDEHYKSATPCSFNLQSWNFDVTLREGLSHVTQRQQVANICKIIKEMTIGQAVAFDTGWRVTIHKPHSNIPISVCFISYVTQ